MSTIDFVLILANRTVFGIFGHSCPVRTDLAFFNSTSCQWDNQDRLDNHQQKESENPGNRCAQLAAGHGLWWLGVIVLATRALNVINLTDSRADPKRFLDISASIGLCIDA